MTDSGAAVVGVQSSGLPLVASESSPMQFAWLSVAIVASVGYHLALKVTPADANPFLSLAITYALVTLVFIGVWMFAPIGLSAPGRTLAQHVSWPALALASAIVFLDLGFLMLYRAGFNVSLGQLVTQSAAALLLLLIGVLVFRERLSVANVTGLGLCIAGLWLVMRR